MRRKLIILSNTGGKKNYLDSVLHDRENYLRYFRSAYGGGWTDKEEIYAPEPNECSWADLEDYMNAIEDFAHVDLWVIVFTGHGWADKNGESYLEPQPGTAMEEDIPVGWIANMTKNSRCLLITDSCRAVLPITESQQPVQREFSLADGEDDFIRVLGRNLYFRILPNIPVGSFTVGFACQYDEKAGNNDDDTGGLYSDALLQAALHEIKLSKQKNIHNDWVSFSYIHSQARQQVMVATDGRQVPVLLHDRANQIPFCVIP